MIHFHLRPRNDVCRRARDSPLRAPRGDVRPARDARAGRLRRRAFHPATPGRAGEGRLTSNERDVVDSSRCADARGSARIILLSFISEDAAAVSSALLVLGGPVAWPVGFVSCFLGIWVGDLGLYSVARWGGRPLLRSRWLARRIDPRRVDRLREEVSRGAPTPRFSLVDLCPARALPTYLAAGLFSMPRPPSRSSPVALFSSG